MWYIRTFSVHHCLPMTDLPLTLRDEAGRYCKPFSSINLSLMAFSHFTGRGYLKKLFYLLRPVKSSRHRCITHNKEMRKHVINILGIKINHSNIRLCQEFCVNINPLCYQWIIFQLIPFNILINIWLYICIWRISQRVMTV